MNNFIKQNYFKAIIAIAILIIAISVGYYFVIFEPKYQKEELDQSTKASEQKINFTPDNQSEINTNTSDVPITPKPIISQTITQQTPPQVDPQIKIELCKTEANTDADNMAKYEASLKVSELHPEKALQGLDLNSPNIQTYLNDVQSVIQSEYDHTYSDRYNYYYQSLYTACLNK